MEFFSIQNALVSAITITSEFDSWSSILKPLYLASIAKMVQEERSVMDAIWRRKKNWIGHILRGESLLREVIEGRMIGKRPRVWKRLGMLNEFLKEPSYEELKRKAEHRKEWRTWNPRTCLTAAH